MAENLKKYKNKSGYTIQATEKAYNLFYKKQGFAPVEDPAAGDSDGKDPAASDPDEKDPAAGDPDVEDPTASDSTAEDPTPEEPAKKGKGKSKKAADKDPVEPEAPAESYEEE